MFQAFKEWGVSLSDVSANTNPSNAAEHQTTVELLNRRYAFSVGLGFVSLSVTNPYWEEAERIAKIATGGLRAILSSANAEVAQQTVQIVMHLKPRKYSVHEATSRFISSDVVPIMGDKVLAYGFSIYSEDSTWVVDRSALDKSALFVRLSKSFDSATSFENIADFLNKEQEKALEVLKLRIVENVG